MTDSETGLICVTQFLLPDGKQRPTFIERPIAVCRMAGMLRDAGYAFESEVLRTGEVHFDVTNDDGVLANYVGPNDKTAHDGFDEMVCQAYATWSRKSLKKFVGHS